MAPRSPLLDDVLGDLDARPAPSWDDLEEAAARNAETLRHLADDRSALRELVLRARSDPRLRTMCECDHFRTKLVLYDGTDRGFRVRLHLWRFGFHDVPHAHRFSYTTLLLHGGYQHTLWDTDQNLYPPGLDGIPERERPIDDPFVRTHIDVTRIHPSLTMNVGAGQSYTQHHSQKLSSTCTQHETVSLFMRGPAARDFSIQWDRDAGTIVWRRGVQLLSAADRARVALTDEGFDDAVECLERLELV